MNMLSLQHFPIYSIIGLGHLGRVDGVEVAYLSETWVILAVLVFKELEPVGCHLCKVS